jgi:nifR3 family TIM-barrel protein
MSLLKRVRIGNFSTENNVFLAPLAGIGDTTYRALGRRFGAGLTFTEMVSAHGIVNASKKTLDLLKVTKRERPTGIQVFGANEEIMSTAVSACSAYPADLIDINGGCSVKKVLKTGAGAGLLGDPDRFYRLVKVCVDASVYPVSVKIRLGLTEDRINVIENALAAQDAGACLLTVHARTAHDRYRGHARWEYIGRVKEALRIPVCGNGDIRSPADTVRMIMETGCDAVMIGRAAIGNLWIIKESVRALERSPERTEAAVPTVEERVACALEHLHMIIAAKGEQRGVREVKRHIHRYLRGIPSISEKKISLFRASSKQEMEDMISALLR